MKRLFVVAVVSILFVSANTAFSETPQTDTGKGTIRIVVEGFPSDQGIAKIALVNSVEGYQDSTKAFMKQKVQISNGKAVWNLSNVPFGKYAVTVQHDENNNGKLDRSILGKPTEVYGFSNNVRRFFGKPDYQKAVFILDKSDIVVRIEVK